MRTTLLLIAFAYIVAAKQCTNVFPAARDFQFPIDICKFDIRRPDTGAKNIPTFDFTCDNNQTISVGDTVYDIPDQFYQPREISGGDTKGINIITNTFAERRADLTADFGSSVLFGLMSSSFSMSASYSMFADKHRMFSYTHTTITGYVVSYHEPYDWSPVKPKLTDEAQGYITNVLMKKPYFNESSESDYAKWIINFGTHYISQMCMGASMYAVHYVDIEFALLQTKEFMSANAHASFFNFVKASGGASGDYEKVDANFVAASYADTYWTGGMGSPGPDGDAFARWAASALVHPHVIPCPNGDPIGIKSYSVLMPDAIKQPFDLAVQNYMDLSFLVNEILAYIDIVVNKIQSFTIYKRVNSCPCTLQDLAVLDPNLYFSCIVKGRSICDFGGCDKFPKISETFEQQKNQTLNDLVAIKNVAIEQAGRSIRDHNKVVEYGTKYYMIIGKIASKYTYNECFVNYWGAEGPHVTLQSLNAPNKFTN